MCFCVYNIKYWNMSAAGSDSDAETVITEGTIEREKGSKEKGTLGKVSQITVRGVGEQVGLESGEEGGDLVHARGAQWEPRRRKPVPLFL